MILFFLSGKELNLKNIKKFLKQNGFAAADAGKLGEKLGVPPPTLKTMVKNRGGIGGDWDEILTEIIYHWLNNDLNKSWKKLAHALRGCDYSDIANVILGIQTKKTATQTGPQQPSPMEPAVSKEQEGK